ncbi:MAG TPA: hypothetical protein VF017_01950 [Thermoanaerobaculia bacterium]|nr:hypothetical protein [Thermoanaerobaculia bacterium]
MRPSAAPIDPAAPSERVAAPWFQRVTFHSTLAALCPLIPIPFLDDWALAWVRRRQVAEALAARHLAATDWHVAVLAGEKLEAHRGGCLLATAFGWTVKAVIYVVKRLFRKLLIFLAIKDGADKFSLVFHEGYLLHHAMERGVLTPASMADPNEVIRVRLALERACGEIDARPVNQLVRRILRGSRGLLREAARGLGRVLRRQRRGEGTADTAGGVEAEQERLLGSLTDRLMADLWHQEGYRAELVAHFERALAQPLFSSSSAQRA